ncbi:MAG: DUF1015 family protein [Phycisphaerales bacterium]
MFRIHPFAAWRPPHHRVAEVACDPYDVISTAEARTLAEGKPASFLRVIRPELEMADDVDPHSAPVYERASRNFKAFIDQGVLQQDQTPGFYVYRLAKGGRRQAGLVACVDVDDYRRGIIRVHEKTRPDKEEDRVQHILATRSHAEPVYLAFRDDEAIVSMMMADMNERPLYHFLGGDGVTHTLWHARDPEAYRRAFARLPIVYVADGHHRSAAAERVAAAVEAGRAAPAADGSHAHFPAVLFPAGQLVILPYNRLVKDLNGLTPEAFLGRLAEVAQVVPTNHPEPGGPGRVCIYLSPRPAQGKGRWHLIQFHPDARKGRDPVGRLDVSLLQDLVLAPILGIGDPRRDQRISFVGGSAGTGALVTAVDEGGAAVAFSMHPTAMEELLAVADAGGIMPPKSTWFDPKLRSGLFVHSF